MTLGGGLVFLYFNIICHVKINLSYTFLHVKIYLIFLRKKYVYERFFTYMRSEKFIRKYREAERSHIYKNRRKYLKLFKRFISLFYIKNISIYPEVLMENQSLGLEFVVVNRLLKKSILNG